MFLFRPDRGVAFVDRPGGTATTATTVVRRGARQPHLTSSPGRIDPTSAAWAAAASRSPASSRFRGATVFAIANHFASKGGDDPLFGRCQQPVRASEVAAGQAGDRGAGLHRLDPRRRRLARVVVLGDINDFEFSPTVDDLVGAQQPAARWSTCPRTLPDGRALQLRLRGQLPGARPHPAQPRPHDGTSRAAAAAYDYDIVHINSEFHDQDSATTTRRSCGWRSAPARADRPGRN